MRSRSLTLGACLSALTAGASQAQTYDDFTFVRNRPTAFSSVLQVQAGVLGGLASDENPTIGLEDEYGWDGHVYFHQDSYGDAQANLDVYAGRDGAYFSVAEGGLLGQETQSRLEISTRYFPFYREGFYRGDDFIPTGQYEALDYGAMIGVARDVGDGLRLEISTLR